MIAHIMVPRPMKRTNIIELDDELHSEIEGGKSEMIKISTENEEQKNQEGDICNVKPIRKAKESIHWPNSIMDQEHNNSSRQITTDGEHDEDLDTEEQGEDYRMVENDFTHEISTGSIQHKRRNFSSEKSSTLIQICNTNISEGDVRMASILASLQADERGLRLLDTWKAIFRKTYLKKVADRVRCEMRARVSVDKLKLL